MKHSVWNRFVSFALALMLAAGPAVSGAQAAHAEQAAQEAQSALPEEEFFAPAQPPEEEVLAEEVPPEPEPLPGPLEEKQPPETEPQPEEPPEEAPSEALPEPLQPDDASCEAAPPAETPPGPETLPAEAPPEPPVQPANIILPTEPEAHTATLRFYAGEALVSEQVLYPGETPAPLADPVQEGAVFEGWLNENGEACDFSAPVPPLDEDVVFIYTARWHRVYTVYYFSQPTGGAVLFTQTYENANDAVNWQQVAFAAPAGMALTGWSTTPGGEAVSAPALTLQPLRLYPVLKTVCWITPQAPEGTPPAPVYVMPGAPAPQLPAAVRQGYQFTGWFTDAACTQGYTPGQPVNSDLVLYAGWKAQSVVYRVAYWQQNADNDGYTLAEVRQHTAPAGTQVQAQAEENRYQHFTLRQTPPAETVQGSGSTVIPVYYDRKVYTVQFYRPGVMGAASLIPELTITARYGADIADKWPSRVDEKWPDAWRITPNGSQYQTGIATMPAPGDSKNPNKFYWKAESGSVVHELRYYVQNLQGTGWELHHTDSFRSNETGWKLGRNDCYDLQGFVLNTQKSPAVGSREKRLENGSYGFELYYDRRQYQLRFYSAGDEEKTVTLPYQAPLAAQQHTPVHPSDSGLVFAGWYENNLGQGEPFDLKAGVMPAGELALYALWKEPVFRVRFELAGGTAPEGADLDDQLVERGKLAQKPGSEPVREGWRFLGWSMEEKPFSFLTPVQSDLTLTALWASETSCALHYSPGLAGGEMFTETDRFGAGTAVRLRTAPPEWTPPKNSLGFLGWSADAQGKGPLFKPGESFVMPGQDTVLYAQWAMPPQPAGTSLVYDYNGGSDAAGAAEKTVALPAQSQDYTIEDPAPQKPGYVLMGWSRQKQGGDVLKPGDVIRVNSVNPETNRLYAQWEKAVVTEVRLVMQGNMAQKNRRVAFSALLAASAPGETSAAREFTLQSGGSYVFEPQPESQTPITVKQEDLSAEGYTTAVSEENRDGRRIITYTNRREIAVPTGVRGQAAPGALAVVMGGAVLGAVGLVRRRRL